MPWKSPRAPYDFLFEECFVFLFSRCCLQKICHLSGLFSGASVGQSGSKPLSGIDLCVSMPIQIEFKKMIKPEIRSRSDPRSIHMDPHHRHHSFTVKWWERMGQFQGLMSLWKALRVSVGTPPPPPASAGRNRKTKAGVYRLGKERGLYCIRVILRNRIAMSTNLHHNLEYLLVCLKDLTHNITAHSHTMKGAFHLL